MYYVREDTNVFAGVSQGFRAPNLSDLTRSDAARTRELETPSPNLEPEYYLTWETGVKMNGERCSGTLSYFFTAIDNMITRYPTGNVIGTDNEVQKSNSGDGYLHGIEFDGEYKVTDQWKPFASLAWQEGEVDTYATSAQEKTREPISRLLPLSAVTGVRWQPTATQWLEGYSRMACKQDKLSPDDKTDTQRIPPGGTPGYAVFGVRGGIEPAKNLSVIAGIDNIANTDYRIHGSGQNEPGTNFVVTMKYRF